jgi:hypothetical protein
VTTERPFFVNILSVGRFLDLNAGTREWQAMSLLRVTRVHQNSRPLLAVAVALAVASHSAGAFGADRIDVFGDVLPAGALARAGTIRQSSERPVGFKLPSSVRGAVFSPDNKLLATRGEPGDPSARRRIRIWDAATGKLIRSFAALSQPLSSMAFSADSTRLISATPNHPQGTQVWNVATGQLVRSLPGGRGQFSLMPGGRTISLVDQFQKNDIVRTFDLTNGAEVGRSVIDVSYRFAFSPDGRQQLAQKSQRSTMLRLLDVNNGRLLAQLDSKTGIPGAMAFAVNGRTVAAATSNRTGRDKVEHRIVVWEVAGERPVFKLAGHSRRVLALCFSPDGRFLTSGSADGSVRVWEIATGKEVHTYTGHTGPISTLDVSSDSARVASGSFDRTVLIWDMNTVQKTFLAKQALDAESFETLWNELAAVSASNAYRAIGQLRLHDQAAANLLNGRIESIVRPVQAERIQQLIADLEHEDFVVRFRATQQLQKLREIARPLLLKAAKGTNSAEVRFRIRRILTGAEETPRFSSADIRRMARVIHVLEYLPGEKAEATLQAIIDDFPSADIVKDARETLGRLRAGK